jgi:hypothetical protein
MKKNTEPTKEDLVKRLSEIRKQEIEEAIKAINSILESRNLVLSPALGGNAISLTIQGQPLGVVVVSK